MPRLAMLFVIASILCALCPPPASAEENFELLLETTAEYGWHYKGTGSWGEKWQRKAVSDANEKIAKSISKMANLEQLEHFSSEDLLKKLGLETEGHGSSAGGGGKFGIVYEDEKKGEKWEVEKYRNNFVVLVEDVRMKPETAWTKTEMNWKQERTFEAGATMLYQLRIYGKRK